MKVYHNGVPYQGKNEFLEAQKILIDSKTIKQFSNFGPLLKGEVSEGKYCVLLKSFILEGYEFKVYKREGFNLNGDNLTLPHIYFQHIPQ
jgi:hypothetical protein